MVTVSFVVAAYNEEDVLGDCLESILSQGYEDFEIIVVDDGSTDQTSEVAETYVIRSSEVRLATNRSNRGSSYTWNRGVSEANGKIVCFIDADCVLSKSWLRRTVDCFAEEEVSVLYGPDLTHPKDGVFAQAVGLGIERGMIPVLIAGNSAFLRSTFLELGGFDEYLRYQEDLDLWKRMQKLGLQPLFNSELIVYHRRESTIREYFQQCYFAVHELFPVWIKHGLDQNAIKPLTLISLLVLLASFLWVPPLDLSRISIATYFSLFFAVWAWRGIPKTKAQLLLPLVYAINYVASITGFLGGSIDHLILPILLPSSRD